MAEIQGKTASQNIDRGLLAKLHEHYEVDKVKRIIPGDGSKNEDWLVIFWEDLQFGVVNIDSTYDKDKTELKTGHELKFGENMFALYGPELLKAIFITRGAAERTSFEIAKKLISTKKRKRKSNVKQDDVQSNAEEGNETTVNKPKEKKETTVNKPKEKKDKDGEDSLDGKLKIKKKVIREENKKKADLRGKVAFEKAKSMFSKINKNVHDQVAIDISVDTDTNVNNSVNDSQATPLLALTNTNPKPPVKDSQSAPCTINITKPTHASTESHSFSSDIHISEQTSNSQLVNKPPLTSFSTQSLDSPYIVHNSQTLLHDNHNIVNNSQSTVKSPLATSSQNPYNIQSHVANGPSMFYNYNNENAMTPSMHHYNRFTNSMYPYQNFQNYFQQSAPPYNTPYTDNTNRSLHYPQPLRPLQSNSSFSSTLLNPYKLISQNQDEERNDISLETKSCVYDCSTTSDNDNETSYENLSNADNDEELYNFTSDCSSGNLASNPISGLDNSKNCMNCLEKDLKIKSLTLQLTNYRQRYADDSTKGFQPEQVKEQQSHSAAKRTKNRLSSTDYKLLSENTPMPPGYQYLVAGSPLVVKTEWLKETLYRLRKKDRSCALKMLIDCLLSPEEYGVRGGTSAFTQSPLASVMNSIENFGLVHFKMLPTQVTRALNEKFYSGRKILQKREQLQDK